MPGSSSAWAATVLLPLPSSKRSTAAPRIQKEADEGGVVLGGCCVDTDDLIWTCADGSHQWGKLKLGRRKKI